MNRLTRVEGLSTLIKDGWKKKDTEKNYTSICYGCEEIRKCVNKCGFCKALDKLAAYEDTGLEPEKISEILELFCWSQNFNGDFKLFITALKQLKEMVEKYEKLEERGLLIKLPCKVGDTVYVNAKTFGTHDDIEYAEAEVVSIRITKKQTFLKLRIFALGLDGMPYGCKNYSISSFGKTVFLTREEAEKALEKVNGNSRS